MVASSMTPIMLIITASLPCLYASFLVTLFWPIAVIPRARLAGRVMTHKGNTRLSINATKPTLDLVVSVLDPLAMHEVYQIRVKRKL